jgi:hypothetical protein
MIIKNVFLSAAITQAIDPETKLMSPNYVKTLTCIIDYLQSHQYHVFSAAYLEKFGGITPSPAEVFERDYHALRKSDVAVFLLGQFISTGCAIELQWAYDFNVPSIVFIQDKSLLSQLEYGLLENHPRCDVHFIHWVENESEWQPELKKYLASFSNGGSRALF